MLRDGSAHEYPHEKDDGEHEHRNVCLQHVFSLLEVWFEALRSLHPHLEAPCRYEALRWGGEGNERFSPYRVVNGTNVMRTNLVGELFSSHIPVWSGFWISFSSLPGSPLLVAGS